MFQVATGQGELIENGMAGKGLGMVPVDSKRALYTGNNKYQGAR